MISIIVPNYNHRKFLPQRLDTIFNQTFQDFEVILLDDCSTDDSWEYLKEYKNHPKVSHCVRNEVNSGSPFKQWKMGVDFAKYDWIWIAESDDFSELDFLERLVTQINDEVSLIFAKSEFVDEKDEPLFFNGVRHQMKAYDLGESRIKSKGTDFLEKFLMVRNYVLNASSAVFKKPSSFPDEMLSMKYGGDWFFWITLAGQGDVIYDPSVSNFYRYHDSTTRSQNDEKSELDRFAEDLLCIKKSQRILGSKFSIKKKLEKFEDRIYYHFRLRFKYGRLRFFSLFPKMPLVFYPLYYKFFLASLIRKK